MRSLTVHLVDSEGNQLVDESGNELVANIQITDYGLSAESSKLILHGYSAAGEYNNSVLTYNLVDQDGNQLVDEGGNELVARVMFHARLLHAQETPNILHGG